MLLLSIPLREDTKNPVRQWKITILIIIFCYENLVNFEKETKSNFATLCIFTTANSHNMYAYAKFRALMEKFRDTKHAKKKFYRYTLS